MNNHTSDLQQINDIDNREATQVVIFLETLKEIDLESLGSIINEVSDSEIDQNDLTLEFFRSLSPNIYKKINTIIEEKGQDNYSINQCKAKISKEHEALALANITDEENEQITALVQTLTELKKDKKGKIIFNKIQEESLTTSQERYEEEMYRSERSNLKRLHPSMYKIIQEHIDKHQDEIKDVFQEIEKRDKEKPQDNQTNRETWGEHLQQINQLVNTIDNAYIAKRVKRLMTMDTESSAREKMIVELAFIGDFLSQTNLQVQKNIEQGNFIEDIERSMGVFDIGAFGKYNDEIKTLLQQIFIKRHLRGLYKEVLSILGTANKKQNGAYIEDSDTNNSKGHYMIRNARFVYGFGLWSDEDNITHSIHQDKFSLDYVDQLFDNMPGGRDENGERESIKAKFTIMRELIRRENTLGTTLLRDIPLEKENEYLPYSSNPRKEGEAITRRLADQTKIKQSPKKGDTQIQTDQLFQEI